MPDSYNLSPDRPLRLTIVDRLRSSAGMSTRTSLRHSYASRLREHGAPLMLISESLGHADLSTTQIYAHLTSSKQRREISKYWMSEA
jgi:site-specific recombinase XerD